jgi:hypothetical protein
MSAVTDICSIQRPMVISTISDLAKYKTTLGLNCQPYDRWVEIIPRDWLDAGKPDIDYVDQKFKCGVCGGKTDKQVRTVSGGTQKTQLRESCLLKVRTVNRNRRARPARIVTGSVTSLFEACHGLNFRLPTSARFRSEIRHCLRDPF